MGRRALYREARVNLRLTAALDAALRAMAAAQGRTLNDLLVELLTAAVETDVPRLPPEPDELEAAYREAGGG